MITFVSAVVYTSIKGFGGINMRALVMRKCQETAINHHDVRHFTIETFNHFLIQHTSFQAEVEYSTSYEMLLYVVTSLYKMNLMLCRNKISS